MARYLAAIATSLVLSLVSMPVIADPGDGAETGDPFAPAPAGTGNEARPPERSHGGSSGEAAFGQNILPENGSPVRKSDDHPNGWFFKKSDNDGECVGQIVDEGKQGESCFKITNENSAASSWRLPNVAVKPNTRYELAVSMRTENVETEEGKGATFGVQDLDQFVRPLEGTHDWKRLTLEFFSEDQTRITILLTLGDKKGAKGTVWFSKASLREKLQEADTDDDSEPPPPTYRRPSLEDPIFVTENLTLDRDQVLALAEEIATIVVGFPDMPETSSHEFQAHALGIALRLDPRNRTAVIANGQLDKGQELKPNGQHRDIYKHWSILDKWAKWLHTPDATADDQALGLYLGDLARRIRPGEGFAETFAKAHPEDLAAAWHRILPPPPPPVDSHIPEVADHNKPDPGLDTTEPGGSTESPPPSPTQTTDKERYKIPSQLPLNTASLFVPVQTGGAESRAALRKVTLTFRDYEIHTEWGENGETKRRVPHSNRGPTEMSFKDNWDGLRDVWWERASPMLDNRYEGWPQRGTIDVAIPDYRGSSGSTAVLATAICFEAMARGLQLDPKVAAVGTWGEEGEFRTHSHLPGIVLGYSKEWPEILIVGPGSLKPLEAVAATGLVTPLLYTQIIEVSSFGEAVAVASGQPSAETKASLEAYRAIMAIRTKMDPSALVQNRHVLEKLRAITAANPKHLSAALMLKASENQKPLDFEASAKIVSRLFRSIEQLIENDIDWVSAEDGLQSIEVFNDRMREFKPRLDRGLDRYGTKMDDCTKIVGETVRIRDRTTGTAMNRIGNAREQVAALRQALDLAEAAGR